MEAACGCVTKGRQGLELADLKAMAPFVAAFSDDGSGVDDARLLKEAMLASKSAGQGDCGALRGQESWQRAVT